MLNSEKIVYFIDTRGMEAYIKFGIISTKCENEYCVEFLVIREHRYVRGVPIQDFTATPWRKIPKEWQDDYRKIDTGVVWRLSEAEAELIKSLRIDNPEDIKRGYEAGLLVPKSKITSWKIETEVNRNKEYRLVRKIPLWTMTYGEDKRTYLFLPEDKLYLTYAEAQEAKRELEAKWKAEADLSDEEWSIQEIDKVLKFLHNEELASKYREKLLIMGDVEDIEIKKGGNNKILWRYFRKTAWEELVV